jgi:transcriptional regulator with XRE-family HTH domain
MSEHSTIWITAMPFPERLARLRKHESLTQQVLADAIRINVSQLKRYEAGTSQPTLEVLRKLAIELSVSADILLFDHDERGPEDDLRLQFEAVSRMSPADKLAIKTVLEGMIVKNRAKDMLEGIGG